jgi:hypothetical protein
LNNVRILGSAMVKLQGFATGTGGYFTPTASNPTGYLPAYPLGMTMTDVLADSPALISVIASDANLTLSDVNLPIFPSAANNIAVTGTASGTQDPERILDCSQAFVDFPAIGASSPFGTHWAP